MVPVSGAQGDSEQVWSLYADWCTATGRDVLESTLEALDAFWKDVPVAASTRERREKALRLSLIHI